MKLDELEAHAKAATPGPWTVLDGDGCGWINELTQGYDGQFPIADCNYIAAANPQTVLALIAVARAAKEEVEDPPVFLDEALDSLERTLRGERDD